MEFPKFNQCLEWHAIDLPWPDTCDPNPFVSGRHPPRLLAIGTLILILWVVVVVVVVGHGRFDNAVEYIASSLVWRSERIRVPIVRRPRRVLFLAVSLTARNGRNRVCCPGRRKRACSSSWSDWPAPGDNCHERRASMPNPYRHHKIELGRSCLQQAKTPEIRNRNDYWVSEDRIVGVCNSFVGKMR